MTHQNSTKKASIATESEYELVTQRELWARFAQSNVTEKETFKTSVGKVVKKDTICIPMCLEDCGSDGSFLNVSQYIAQDIAEDERPIDRLNQNISDLKAYLGNLEKISAMFRCIQEQSAALAEIETGDTAVHYAVKKSLNITGDKLGVELAPISEFTTHL